METAPLKSFATWARRELITQVNARLTAVLAPASPERIENPRTVSMLERDITAGGGGAKGKDAIADKVAYTWFNRIIALRFMDANGYTRVGVVSPAHGQQTGQPEILADAKRGIIDPTVVSNKRTLDTITGILDGTRPSTDAQGEAYTLLLAEYCRYWNHSMPFMFEREGDYTELLIPSNLLAADSILTKAVAALTTEVCRDVEVIGWLYQFYISERKDEVFAGFKKGKKAGAAEIPAATQLFTPHWIVRYLVENSVGRLWMLNHPSSRLIEQMDYYIAPVDEETDFLKISTPEELKIIDPACGSGHMLTYAFDLLYAIYEEEGYAPSEIPELILTHNLYGAEIDPRAGALAAFALTMKARDKHRAFLGKMVRPRIHIIERILFSNEELTFLTTGRSDRSAEVAFWNQFVDADTMGSLIQPDPVLTVRLAHHLTSLTDSGDLLRANTLELAERVVRQAEALLPRYSVVIANPPYLGDKTYSSSLRKLAADLYVSSKQNTYSMFMKRAVTLVMPKGYAGLVVLHSWMSGAKYEAFRNEISDSSPIVTLTHLGSGGFDSIDGEVVSTAAFILQLGRRKGLPGVFVDLTSGRGETAKADLLKLAIHRPDAAQRYQRSSEDFLHVPGHVLAYYATEHELAAFRELRSLGDLVDVRQGMATTDNGRFLRQWFEVPVGHIAFGIESGPQAVASGRTWFPYNKGGSPRGWYGNQDLVVNWRDGGREIKENIVRKYPYLKGKWGFVAKNPDFYFRPCLTYSALAGGGFAVRVSPPGFIFDTKGSCVFPTTHLPMTRLAALMNSSVVARFLSLLAPTLDFTLASVKGIPVPHAFPDELDVLAEEAVGIAKADWDDFETSWDFRRPMVLDDSGSLRERVLRWRATWAKRTETLTLLQTRMNSIVASAYGLDQGADGLPVESVSLARNVNWTTGPVDAPEHQARVLDPEFSAEIVSYSVGCMFGRYSLDKPGLILAEQEATVHEYLAEVPTPTFVPDADNVLPVVDGDWFEDDIVARFREFLRVAFGEEHFDENLRLVEESLGVNSLREYFITRAGRSRFYDDHVKRYKKRPIYWLFSSPKGSFNALIYMHRYTPSTVSTVLNEYLREFIAKLEASLQHQERVAAGDGTARVKAGALKEAERLRKILVELNEYEHGVLYPLASQQVAIDLDDGVKVNYPKFYPALKRIKGLEAADD